MPRDEHAAIKLGALTPQNIGALKLLNRNVFPVTYNDKLYDMLLVDTQLTSLGAQTRF